MAAAALALVVLPAAAAHAQDDPPPHLAYADPGTTIDRESESVDGAAGEALLPGDRVRTGTGRAEIWFPDGTTLALDDFTTVEVGDGRIRHTAGRVIVSIPRPQSDRWSGGRYEIDTPAASVLIDEPGEYKISVREAGDPAVDVAVVRGRAEIAADRGSTTLHDGEWAEARRDDAPSSPRRFNSARLDGFDVWAADRRDERRSRRDSVRHLPSELQVYGGTFDRYGTWEYDPGYGSVWYPTVAPGWRPYYRGYWRPLRAYGWTWIGLDPWGWPTHHYGRWGLRGARWFWIPDRRWAPAWVSWATAADYVSWCPLGFDNRPVVGFSLTVGNAWAGWVVMPRTYFGVRAYPVQRYAIEGRRLPRHTPFAFHAAGPRAPSGRDVGRGGWADRGGWRDGGRGGPERFAAGRTDARRASPGVAVPRSGRTAGVSPGATRNGFSGGRNDRPQSARPGEQPRRWNGSADRRSGRSADPLNTLPGQAPRHFERRAESSRPADVPSGRAITPGPRRLENAPTPGARPAERADRGSSGFRPGAPRDGGSGRNTQADGGFDRGRRDERGVDRGSRSGGAIRRGEPAGGGFTPRSNGPRMGSSPDGGRRDSGRVDRPGGRSDSGGRAVPRSGGNPDRGGRGGGAGRRGR